MNDEIKPCGDGRFQAVVVCSSCQRVTLTEMPVTKPDWICTCGFRNFYKVTAMTEVKVSSAIANTIAVPREILKEAIWLAKTGHVSRKSEVISQLEALLK